MEWLVLLAYQIYSNSGLNSPGVLKVFDLAMNISILGSFVSALLLLLLKLQISVHHSIQFLKDLLWCLLLSCLCHRQRIPSIHLVPFCLHKQEHIDGGNSMLPMKLLLDEQEFSKSYFFLFS